MEVNPAPLADWWMGTVRTEGGVGRHAQPCSLTLLSWGALGALGCAQLFKPSMRGDVEAVKKLLARPDVDVNYADEVRGRVWAP